MHRPEQAEVEPAGAPAHDVAASRTAGPSRDLACYGPSYLLNLPSRPDRLAHARAELSREGVDHIRLPAKTGHEAAESGVRSIAGTWGRTFLKLTPGAIGCAASHLHIYTSVAEANMPGAFIFEDDVALTPGFATIASELMARREPTAALVQLGSLAYAPSMRTRLGNIRFGTRIGVRHFRLHTAEFRWGTHAYWISREFAAAATELFNPIFAPIDAMLRCVTYSADWRCQIVLPPIAWQSGATSDVQCEL